MTQLQLILKWGGELTATGLSMSKQIGRNFREQFYVADDTGGLLRLHSTFRHDLKLYSSDEGRVQTTAASFAKGLLALDGELPGILASLVRKGHDANAMLDDCSAAKKGMSRAKDRLHRLIAGVGDAAELSLAERQAALNPLGIGSVASALRDLNDPADAMKEVLVLLGTICDTLTRLRDEGRGSGAFDEDVSHIFSRWVHLRKDFFSKKKGFNVSKVPDIFDMIRYDVRYNFWPELRDPLEAIYYKVRALACVIVPQEYGLTRDEKSGIAAGITERLRAKIGDDLALAANRMDQGEEEAHRFSVEGAGFLDQMVKSPQRHVRSRYYFSSESHLYAMLNFLRFADPHVMAAGAESEWTKVIEHIDQLVELRFLTQIVFRLFEHQDVPTTSPNRYTVDLHFCVGHKPQQPADRGEGEPAQPMLWHRGIPLGAFARVLTAD